MEIQKVKISDLPVTEDLNGLKTLGTTAENTSKAAELTFIADAATSANEAATNANQAAENANTSAANADAKAEAAQKAADNATVSANQADQAAVNANTATTRATAAAEKAENAADVAIGVVNEAQQAAANANQAAQSANEAATNANQAAASANDAATEAHTQAEYAKTQGDYAKAEGDRVLAEKGQPGGLAELDESGRVPSSQLPSYVDDVVEYPSPGDFPSTGEEGKIYVTKDTNLTYRWSGTGYVEISKSLALGETSSTAYRGDRGKAAYDHSQVRDGSNPHRTTFESLLGKPASYSPVTDQNSNGSGYKKLWTGTEDEYAALSVRDANTLYVVLKTGANYLTVTPSSLSFAGEGESETLQVNCNASLNWSVTGLPSGWSASPASGTGPATVAIAAPENPAPVSVRGTITVSGGGMTASCSYLQEAGHDPGPDPEKPTITLSASMDFPALGTPIVKAEASQACLDDITVEVRGYLDSTNMWGPQYINIQSGNSGGQVEVSGLTPSGSVTIEKVNNTEIQPVNTDNATYTW